ncbi:MAG: hypothetical protein A2722_02735 [Candidatus Doudnabacteria bacterium RIFCSPHIGHO2_01_FULL_50_11]|uniref:Amidohydrolase 3 domain-containing protein n=1 Tax=Candidatus Doudnabacteria bacterium RIFCSPHIGHO2_01_FULL_50_11 TaxID=1817828 RepID=A0A1F5PL34_9BACT|nr:MAG: hypothetical protein A2722_02735 [Candidatus Doudnabacteria bacterium RIFCSPHIGHO2_01_FULL_50_11]
MLDLVIKNGTIVDGTGSQGVLTDLAVKNGEIVELGKLRSYEARVTINAQGLYVCPGFIDIQNHSDSYWTLFDYPKQDSMIAQGITTITVGQCGASLAPLPSIDAIKSVQKWHSLSGVNINWQHFEELLVQIERQELGVNVASLVGHSTLRRGLIGDTVRALTSQEVKMLEKLTTQSLRSGAWGMSMGLAYAHEYNSSISELDSAATLLKERDRLLSVHLRSEGAHILDALDEVLHLAEATRVRMKISHFKLQGANNWPLFPELLSRLEQAYQKGLAVSFDVYPYTTSWTVLYTYLPKWAYEGGREQLIKRLSEPYHRNRILQALLESRKDLSSVKIATTTEAPHLIGRTLLDIAADQGVSPEEAILNILLSTESEVVVFDNNTSEEHLHALLTHPLSMIASNGAGFPANISQHTRNLVHPRCFGSTAQFLSLARNKKILTLEQAIHKVTGRPAEILGLADRGLLKSRMKADLVIFDYESLRDLATFENPYQSPLGIRWVIIGGKLALAEGELTGGAFGRVLRAE